MSRYRGQVAEALGAIAIHGPLSYAWLGRRNRLPPRALRDAMDDPARRSYLCACVRQELYCSFYCPGRVVAARWGAPAPPSADAGLVRLIAAANAGRGGWESGWTVVERRDARGAVVSSGRVRALASECAAAPGAEVSLPRPPQLPGPSPGFVSIAGDAGDGDGAVRVYWHVTARGAPELVRALTSRLNAEAVPFRFKVAHHPLRFDRCDAAVLYLGLDDFGALRPALCSLADELAPWLRPLVPAFTLPLAPGAGAAEDEGESFGLQRCELLAEGVVDAYERGADRLDAVLAVFARGGVDIDAPYRAPSLSGRHVL